MNSSFRSSALWLFCAALTATPCVSAVSSREHLSLDLGWKFHLGEGWPLALRLDKAGASAGPASDKAFSDATWRTVNLPHDWAIELPFDKAADMNHGETQNLTTDDKPAIYRAHLALTEADLGGAGAEVHFSGCDDEGWYFVNGRFVGETHEWNATPASSTVQSQPCRPRPSVP